MIERGGDRHTEEVEEYLSLNEADRKWICFALDMAERPPRNPSFWMEEYGDFKVLPASETYSVARAVFVSEGRKAIGYHFSANAYPQLIRAGLFTVQYGVCCAYPPFRFLLERLFGGVARRLIPSVFLAVAASPEFEGIKSPIRSDDLSEALSDIRLGLLGTTDCVFMPQWPHGLPDQVRQ